MNTLVPFWVAAMNMFVGLLLGFGSFLWIYYKDIKDKNEI